jgi:hypothetical protein
LLAAPARADERWTFCVARDLDDGNAWLSAVFPTNGDRVALEAAFKAYVVRLGPRRVDAQCPLPQADHTEVVNDQFGAEQFNRQSGSSVHLVGANEFPPRR